MSRIFSTSAYFRAAASGLQQNGSRGSIFSRGGSRAFFLNNMNMKFVVSGHTVTSNRAFSIPNWPSANGKRP